MLLPVGCSSRIPRCVRHYILSGLKDTYVYHYAEDFCRVRTCILITVSPLTIVNDNSVVTLIGWRVSTTSCWYTCQSGFTFLPGYSIWEWTSQWWTGSVTLISNWTNLYMHKLYRMRMWIMHIPVSIGYKTFEDQTSVHLWRSWWGRLSCLLTWCSQRTMNTTSPISGKYYSLYIMLFTSLCLCISYMYRVSFRGGRKGSAAPPWKLVAPLEVSPICAYRMCIITHQKIERN